MEKSREYRALKQRKQRTFRESCVNRIIELYNCNEINIWKLLSTTFSPYSPDNGPSGGDLLIHYQSMAGPQYSLNFDYRYEETAVNFCMIMTMSHIYFLQNRPWKMRHLIEITRCRNLEKGIGNRLHSRPVHQKLWRRDLKGPLYLIQL